MKLDERAIARLPLPHGKTDVIYFDDDLAGFGLRLRASGRRLRRTWVAQYRAHGRTRRMRLGAAEKLTAKQAREAAKRYWPRLNLATTRKATRRRRGQRPSARCAPSPRTFSKRSGRACGPPRFA